ncbi:TrkH family potassium uptake protein [Sedimentitalea arenosa]|uniref:TrkH family potassium uptake protein n=1 Tax=Sedimentitalea arenosa TaxID=2798803 RepID=A0A8J7LVY0_9RHOB|nr:potassium transporter TrkG [Arenibacterium arenosum]MBJ6371565.1 TrkH family potassium uptake protein [Arenibacterium arenosum]
MSGVQTPTLLLRLPVSLLIWGVASASMFVPASHALVMNNHPASQSFFYSGVLGLIGVTLISLALAGRRPRFGTLGQLVSLLFAFAILPVYLAVPLHDALSTTSFFNAYFDMVSAITTTGANLFSDPSRLSPSLHLWRAQVGWMGGLMMWIAASAILAPLSLGGFEVTARGQPGRGEAVQMLMAEADPRRRLLRITAALTPVYVGLTVALWVLLLISGERSLVALCHAMSVMATSGISPVGGPTGASAGITGEILMFLFMFFALSRLTFSGDTSVMGNRRLDRDPEFRIGLLLVIGLTLLLFLRHWAASLEVVSGVGFGAALHAFWGAMFTVMSFLTTTGFESADWEEARRWSGLGTPGLILMGLSVIGGGVATTAGGVKLLRVFALYMQGRREMERLVHPSSVSKSQNQDHIQNNGAFIAWVFFMLFAMSIAVISLALAALGVSFDHAIVLSIATLSTTGPVIEVAAETPIKLVELNAAAKAVLCAAMVLGRLETLAIIALFTPDLWRSR